MRLAVTRGSHNVWARLEPETTEEMLALEACAARGEWTNGRGASGIATLRALAARLGYPVEAPVRRGAAGPPPRLVVVRQGNLQLYERSGCHRATGHHRDLGPAAGRAAGD